MKDNLNKKSKAVAHQLSMDMYLKVVKLAEAKGKKPGDSMEEELQEVLRANPDKITPITTKQALGKALSKHKRILDIRKDKKYAWVKYECGCSEGLWIDGRSKCLAHNKPIIETSMKVDLKPPFEDKKDE